MKNNNYFYLYYLPAALALPFLTLGIWVIWTAVSLASGREVILPVSGYDPRDVISGHYISFNIDYPGGSNCLQSDQPSSMESCYCITDIDEKNIVTSGYFDPLCGNRNSCHVFIKGRCDYGRFEAGIDRFFVNEAQAPLLEKRLREKGAFIKLSVDYTGKALIRDFLWE